MLIKAMLKRLMTLFFEIYWARKTGQHMATGKYAKKAPLYTKLKD